jgi:predicted SAM-dependent methyltransferase
MLGITIVTPSLNQATYLEQCIDSILSQNYPNLEYIIMDGGSTDGSVEIIKKYEKHLSYWQSKPDGGHYQALNAGFARSHSPVMAWLNSDDKYHPGALWLVSDAFRAHPEIEWLTGSPTIWDRDGRAAGFSLEPPRWSRDKYLRGETKAPYIQQESTFWRHSLWDKIGLHIDTNFQAAADLELWARFFRHAQLHTLHAPLGGFRSHPGEGQRSEVLQELYQKETESIVARERSFFSNSGSPQLQPAPQPLLMGELVERAQSRITPENFVFFSYSRSIHFPYFAGMDLELYSQAVTPGSCGVRTYQELLAYTFIRHNLPKGAKILATARAHSRLATAAGTDYEFWALSEDGSSGALPEGHFDLVLDILPVGQDPTAQDRCPDICHELARVLKPGGRALHCFDLRAGPTCFASHPLLPYLLQATGGRGVMPFEQAPLDPFVFFSSEAPRQAGRGEAPAQAGGESARWLSYNVLWSPEQRAEAARPAATLRTPPAPAPEAHPAPRRLHIGGEERSEGWEILNILPGPHVDHLGNANDLSRFSDGSFQEIYASHTVEHFDYQNELLATLKEWHRVLRPFGTLYLSVPDLDVMARLLLDKERLNVDDRFAVMRMMFGGHMDPHDFHGVGLNEDFLTYFLHEAGFAMMQKVDKIGLFQDTSDMEFKGELISLNMVARKLTNR